MMLRGEAFSPSLQSVKSSSPSNVAVAVMGEDKEWEGQDGAAAFLPTVGTKCSKSVQWDAPQRHDYLHVADLHVVRSRGEVREALEVAGGQ